MSENTTLNPSKTGVEQLSSLAEELKEHAEGIKKDLQLDNADVAKALKDCEAARKNYTDKVASANTTYTNAINAQNVTEVQRKQAEEKRDSDIKKASDEYLKTIAGLYNKRVEKFLKTVSETGGKQRVNGLNITFENAGSLLEMIQTIIQGEQIEKDLINLGTEVQNCIDYLKEYHYDDKEMQELMKFHNLMKWSDKQTAAAQQNMIDNVIEADKKFREAKEAILNEYKKGVEKARRDDKKFLANISALQTDLAKKLKEVKDSNADSKVAQEFNDRETAREQLLKVMQNRITEKYDVNIMTDAVIAHALGRSKLQANYDKASKSYEDFKSFLIKEDNFSGRLLKAFTHKGGWKASIKEDIRKDFESWGYGGPKNLAGLLRAGFTHWVLTRHDKKKLQANESIQESDVYEKEIQRKIEAAVAERNKICEKLDKKHERLEKIGSDTSGQESGEFKELKDKKDNESDEGKKAKYDLQFKTKQLLRNTIRDEEIPELTAELNAKKIEVANFIDAAKKVGAIDAAKADEYNTLPKTEHFQPKEIAGAESASQEQTASKEETINRVAQNPNEAEAKFAEGGRPEPGTAFLVGEAGPEVGYYSKDKNLEIFPMAKKQPSLGGNAASKSPDAADSNASIKKESGPKFESAAEFEMKQRQADDMHVIAENVKTIVELLQKQGKEKPKEKGFFEKLLDAILGLGTLFGPTLAKIARFIKGIKAFLTGGKLFKSLAGLLGKGGLLGKIGGFFSSIFGKGGKLASFFSKIGKGISSIFGKGGKIAGFFGTIGKFFSKGGFIATLGKVFGKLGPLFKTIAPFFKIVGKLAAPLRVIFTAIDAFKGWTDKDLHKDLFNLKDGEEASTGQKYQAMLSSIFSGLTFGLVDTKAMHKFLSTGFTGIFYNGLGSIIDFGVEFFNAEDKWEFVKKKLGNIKEAIMNGLGRIGEWFSEKWKDAKEWVSNSISSLWEGMKTCFSNVGEWITEKASAAWEWIKENNPITAMWNGLKGAGEWIAGKASEAGDFLKENNPITLLSNGLSNIGGWISETASSMWNSLKETSIFKTLESGFGTIGEYFTERLDFILNFIKENNPFKWISDGFDAVKKWFDDKYQNLSATLEEYNPLKPIFGLFDKIKEFFSGLSPSAIARSILPEWMIKYLPLDDATKAPEPGKFAEGGIVNPSKDGQLAIVGEGGEKEAIMPMSKLASLVLESFKLLKPSDDTHHGKKEGGFFEGLKRLVGLGGQPKKDSSSALYQIEKNVSSIQENVEKIYKMIRFIKVDDVALGDYLDNASMGTLVAKMAKGGVAAAGAAAALGAQQTARGIPGLPGTGGSGRPAPGLIPEVSGGPAQMGADGFLSMKDMGSLAGKYESGGSSAATVDNGDTKGTSFGKYQIAGSDRRKEFLSYISKMGGEGSQIAQQLAAAGFVNSTGNNSQAAMLWKQLANAGKIQQYEDAFGKEEYFGTTFRNIKSEKAKEMIKNSPTLQKALFSYSLQGQNGAYQGINRDFKEGMSEEDLLLLMYNDRLNRAERNKRNFVPQGKSGRPLIVGLRNRLGTGAGSERNLALGMLKAEQQQKAAGTFQPPSGGGTPVAGGAAQAGPTINPVNAGDAKNALTEGSIAKLEGVHPELRKRFLAAAAEFYATYHKKLYVRSGKRTEAHQAQIKAGKGNNASGNAEPLKDGKVKYAPHVCGLALDVYGDKKEDSQSTLDLLDNSGILQKYGLWRPLKNGNGSCDPEYWHIEPEGSRDRGAYGLPSGIVTNITAARFGIKDAVGNGNFGDSSGGMQSVPQDKPEIVPGMAGSPVAGAPTPAQAPVPNFRMPGAGYSSTPPAAGASYGGPMTPAATPAAAPSLGMGGGGAGGATYGGGNLAGRLLGIAKHNADISGVHGYSQDNRLGANQFDCSSFVGRSLKEAGYDVGPIGDFTTATMDGKLKRLGFQWHSGLDGAQPGDIMFRKGHTEIYIGGGKTIGALNSKKGVGVHPLSWGKYTGYYRDGAVAQMSPEEQAQAQQAMMAGGDASGMPGAIPGQGGNVRDAMGGMQQAAPGMGDAASGPQIQGSQQAQLADQASAYYAAGGSGGGGIANQTNIYGGASGNAEKETQPIISIKDPMSWVILQGNTVH